MQPNGDTLHATDLPAVRERPPVPVPATMNEQLLFAQMVIKSGLAPPAYKTPEAVIVALQMGAELGMFPMQALRFINVIQGRPILNADGCVAVVMASGKAEYFYPEEQTPTRATFVTKRKGAPSPVRATFTIEQAEAASLTKNATYKAYPERMLSARAKTNLARDVYADVVGGIVSSEEAADMVDAPAPEPIHMPGSIETTAKPGEAEVYISEPQRKRMFVLLKEHGTDHATLKEYLGREHGVASTASIPAAAYEAVCGWIEAQGAEPGAQG